MALWKVISQPEDNHRLIYAVGTCAGHSGSGIRVKNLGGQTGASYHFCASRASIDNDIMQGDTVHLYFSSKDNQYVIIKGEKQ